MTEHILVRKDRTVFTAEISGKILPDGSMQSIVRDITERKKFEADLISAKEKAEESDRLKTSFLQNISHEIRTPLNAIMGFSELLTEYLDDEEKLIGFTNLIKQRGNDLLEIINDILDFARIESGQISLSPEECKMNLLFAEMETVFQECQSRLNNNQVQFHLEVDQNIRALEVLIDRDKLKQILINLIENAFKFTSSGIIELGCTINEQNVFTFYVSDTGIGIPKDKQTEIFNRFVQASHNTSRLYGGTGLGLSIAQGLIVLLGGEIWLESETGQGSTFYFTMPFKANNLHIPKIAEEKVPENPYKNPFVKILIVEEDEYSFMYLNELLSETEFTILHTKYGKEAVDICTRQPIDLVLMDIRLSDMTGYELACLIKKQNPGVSIIAQTAYVTPEDEKKALAAGCVDYLCKPIRREFLLSRINVHLKQSKNRTHS
ncbi:MAG TPA: ATP-binding protein [Prolixibacteraceae bacterium]|nr:ATP-binding protein [Prolixibacteraceae bacterium]